MLKIRYLIRLVNAFIQRFKIIITIAIIAGVLFFFVLRTLLSDLQAESKIIGITGRFTINSLPKNILQKISYGLTDLDENGNPIPSIATSWSTPNKGKSWTFKLDKNIKWQDGKNIKSNEISYGFNDVVESYPADDLIEFKLQNNYASFPSIVSKPVFKKGLLGVGEWQVKKLKLSGNFIENITLINTAKKTVEYKFYPTEDRTKLAFKLGEVTEIENLSNLNPFDTWKKISISEKVNLDEYVGIFFNNQDKILSDKSVRQALSYAIDKTDYLENRAISPISPTSWAYNSQVKKYDTDKTKAKEVIDQFKKDSKIEIIEITLSTYPNLIHLAEKIAKDWEEVGIKVNIASIGNELENYQALVATFDIPEDPDQYSIWHSTQKNTNFTKYQDSRIDKLLEDGRNEIDINIRKKTYLDFQRFLVEDAPAAFLYYPKSYTISRK